MEQALEKLAKVEHLLLRNSGNSSMPPSKDDDSGRTPPRKERRAKPPGRAKGKQRGAPGTALRWREEDGLDDRLDRYPMGARDCGADLAEATDPGVVDHYQQHEIPLVSVTVTQYDQLAVACGCGQVHTANFSGRPKVSLDGGIEEFPEFRPRRRSSSAPPGGNRSSATASSSARACAAATCRWSSPISARRSSRDADPRADAMTTDPAAPTPHLLRRQEAGVRPTF